MHATLPNLRQTAPERSGQPLLRVLVLAYACSPYKGSEAGVGWHRVVESAKYFDTCVICEKDEFEDDIRRYLRKHGEIPTLHFHFIPRLPFAQFAERRLRPLYYLAYNLWQRSAYRLACRLHRELHFDLVHQLTMCGFREPGYLWKMDMPFVWGPVGGTQNYPWRLLPAAGIGAVLKEGLRNVANALQFRLSPRVGRAARRTAVLLAANSVGRQDFLSVHKVAAERELDVGAKSLVNPAGRHDEPDSPLRLLWSGTLDHHKALHLLIEALAIMPESCRYELKVLGSGPLERRLQSRARRLGIDGRIHWMGHVPYEQAMADYEQAHLFVFTSCRDTCGAQVLEALSRGLPIVCLDHQGVGDVVTRRCGIKVPLGDFREVVGGLRDAIVALSQDRRRLEAMSHAALERAAEFLWERKGEKMADVYRRAVQDRLPSPRE